MKNRIILHGDSFASIHAVTTLLADGTSKYNLQFGLGQTWQKMLADKLDFELDSGSARDGVGNDYIITQLLALHMHGKHQEGDIHIVTTSEWNRKWMVPDHPGCSHLVNLGNKSFRDGILSEVQHSIRPKIANQMDVAYNWRVHNFHEDGQLPYTEQCSLFNMVNYIRKEFNSNILVIPGFEPSCYWVENKKLQSQLMRLIPDPNEDKWTVNGYLNFASMEEFAGDTFKDRLNTRERYFTKVWNTGVDARPCHLSVENHSILANRLYDTIANNTPLDLTEGFVKDIYK